MRRALAKLTAVLEEKPAPLSYRPDVAADVLGIPDTRLKHVLARVGPVLSLVAPVRRTVFGGRQALTERSYRIRDEEMARMRAAYRVTHDLVDAAPR